MTLPAWLGMIFLVSELLLTLTRRSRGSGVRQDRSTLRFIWVVIAASVAAGLWTADAFPRAAFSFPKGLGGLAVFLFAGGLALRWWAIVVLGRFFTVDVQVAPDHELVERGPFRLVRHPSYSGVLLAFVGFSLSLENWAAFVVIMVPVVAVFLHRIKVEEAALTAALGEPYRAYTRRTRRLLPFIY